MLDNQILEAYKQGINAWQKAFNSQDAKANAKTPTTTVTNNPSVKVLPTDCHRL